MAPNASQLSSVSDFMKMPADKYGNDNNIEIQWAMKAYHHAEVYFDILTAVGDPSILKLSAKDDEIYTHFRELFPKFTVDVLNEAHMKTPEQKALWRKFAETYKGRVEDYNMGTLIRIDSKQEVGESNTTIVLRVQFLAIEIARNREGYNNGLATRFGKKKKESKEKS